MFVLAIIYCGLPDFMTTKFVVEFIFRLVRKNVCGWCVWGVLWCAVGTRLG